MHPRHTCARAARVVPICLALAVLGCSESAVAPSESPPTGQMSLGLAAPPDNLFDVTAVRFEVTPLAGGDVQSRVVPLEAEGLPAAVDPSLAGHRFADWFVVLNPGQYNVRAVPLAAEGQPSRVCAAVDEDTTVFPEVTTELLLVSNCRGGANGGLDTSVVFNARPYIEELNFRDSKFVCSDEPAVISVVAGDPDGDELTYEWAVIGLPEGADHTDYCLIAQQHFASFAAVVEGRYELRVTASDGEQTASLSFPVYVSHCRGRGECPGDVASPVLPQQPAVFSGQCVCGGLDIDPNWDFDPANEWPVDPPEGPAEDVPGCAPDQAAIFGDIDANEDGVDDIVGIVGIDPDGAQCEQRYCVEENGAFVEVFGPVIDPALPIPLAATSDGCDGAPPMVACPILSDGTQAQDCGGIPAEAECMTITMCPDRGAWADPADASVVETFDVTDADDPVTPAEEVIPLDPADLLVINPCNWDFVTGFEADLPVVPEEGENPLLAEIEKGSDRWKVEMTAGIDAGRVRANGIFHHSLDYELESHTITDLRLRAFGSWRDIVNVDADSAVSSCAYRTRYDTQIAGDSIDLDGQIRTQVGDDNWVNAEVGDIDESSNGAAEDLCEQRLAALRVAERAANEALHDALIAWAFFNLAGPNGTVIDSQAAAQGFINDYEDAVDTYVFVRDAFHDAQTAATDHSFAALIAQTDLSFQLSHPLRTGIGIGPFSVNIEANAVGKVGIGLDMESGSDSAAECDGQPCLRTRSRTNITPRASVGGYLFFSASIGLGQFLGVEAGIRGELDFANFQLPIVADFGMERTVEPLGPPVVDGDLGDMLGDEVLVQPSAASFAVPYAYGANLVGHFLSGRIDLVVRAWVLFFSREWKKTIASWDGIVRTWQIGEDSGDGLAAFREELGLGAMPDFVSLPVLTLQAPLIPLPADQVAVEIVDALGHGHFEHWVGTPWENAPDQRCGAAIP